MSFERGGGRNATEFNPTPLPRPTVSLLPGIKTISHPDDVHRSIDLCARDRGRRMSVFKKEVGKNQAGENQAGLENLGDPSANITRTISNKKISIGKAKGDPSAKLNCSIGKN